MKPTESSLALKILRPVLKAAVVVGIFVYLYKKGLLDFRELKDVLLNPAVILPSIAALLITNTATAYRWKLLLEGQAIHLTLRKAIELTFIGVFFNTALPGAVSGDLVKGYMLVKKQPQGAGRSKAITTLLLDRVVGVSALVFVAFTALIFNLGPTMASATLRPMGVLVGLLFAGVVGFYVFVLGRWGVTRHVRALLHKSPMGDKLIDVFDAVKAYEKAPRLILDGLAISVGIHMTLVGLCVALARILPGFEMVSYQSYFQLVPLGLLVTAVPVAPAGLGTGHAAFFGLFKLVGCTRGANLFNAYAAIQILISLIGGAVYLKSSHGHPVQTFEAMEPGAGS